MGKQLRPKVGSFWVYLTFWSALGEGVVIQGVGFKICVIGDKLRLCLMGHIFNLSLRHRCRGYWLIVGHGSILYHSVAKRIGGEFSLFQVLRYIPERGFFGPFRLYCRIRLGNQW